LSFLKKHYEKIVLTFLLVVFVVLLVLQISILLEGKNIDPSDLKLPKKDPDYPRVNFKDQQKYGAIDALAKNDKWDASAPRQEGDKIFTDICQPIDLAKCPFCNHLVPSGDFKAGKCSYCAHVLPPKPDEPDDPNKPKSRLPLATLKKYNITEAQLDEDFSGNGFTNYEKIKAGCGIDLKDPKNHPPFVTKLSVVEIVRKKLNMRIAKIIIKGEDKSQWEVHMQIQEGGKDRTRFPKFGGVVKSDDGEYKVIDIIPEISKEMDQTLKSLVEKNNSKVILQRVGTDDKVIGEIGREMMEAREKIILLYGITNKNFELYVGDTLTLGSEATGEEKYVVADSDPNKMTVTLKRDGAGGQSYVIQQTPAIKSEKPANPGGPMPMPGMPGMPPR